jgi:hypothetical protein
MLFSKAILQAEWDADAPMREAMAIKRARLEAKRVEKARRSADWEARQARGAAERLALFEGQNSALRDKQ